MNTTTPTPTVNTITRLERPSEGRVVAGVAAAVADRAGVSVALVRLGFVVAALIGGLGALLYLAGWALIPAEGTAHSPAEVWLDQLTTPGKRLGAFAVGIAGLLIIAAASPVATLAAIALLAAAAWLAPPLVSVSEPSPSPIDDEQE